MDAMSDSSFPIGNMAVSTNYRRATPEQRSAQILVVSCGALNFEVTDLLVGYTSFRDAIGLDQCKRDAARTGNFRRPDDDLGNAETKNVKFPG